MIENDTRRLAAHFDRTQARGSEAALDRALAAARTVPQRPAWVVSLRGGTIADEASTRRGLALAAVMAVALVGVLLAASIGGWFRDASIVGPTPSNLPTPANLPSTSITPSFPGRVGLVAFTTVTMLERGVECPDRVTLLCYLTRAWIADADGSNAHELLPDDPREQEILAWSADGSRLLVLVDGKPALTDASGSPLEELPEMIGILGGEFGLSPDGTRMAFVRTVGTDEDPNAAVLDVATGRVTNLEATRSGADLGRPTWSPDGQWIAYERYAASAFGGRVPGLYLVRPDGSDVRQLTSDGLFAIDPDWSPDGRSLVFTSSVPVNDEAGGFVSDVYTLSLDGRSPVRITTDGISARPSWTIDGRIVFLRLTKGEDPSGFQLWLTDADGAAETRLNASSLAALSEVGCRACLYPPSPPESEITFMNEAVWQPSP